ncbi:unnamed protein product [Caenorhabditis brenneri]
MALFYLEGGHPFLTLHNGVPKPASEVECDASGKEDDDSVDVDDMRQLLWIITSGIWDQQGEKKKDFLVVGILGRCCQRRRRRHKRGPSERPIRPCLTDARSPWDGMDQLAGYCLGHPNQRSETRSSWIFGQKYECLKSLKGHEYTASSVTFLPTGGFVLSASKDHTIKQWDISAVYSVFTLTKELRFDLKNMNMGIESWIMWIVCTTTTTPSVSMDRLGVDWLRLPWDNHNADDTRAMEDLIRLDSKGHLSTGSSDTALGSTGGSKESCFSGELQGSLDVAVKECFDARRETLQNVQLGHRGFSVGSLDNMEWRRRRHDKIGTFYQVDQTQFGGSSVNTGYSITILDSGYDNLASNFISTGRCGSHVGSLDNMGTMEALMTQPTLQNIEPDWIQKVIGHQNPWTTLLHPVCYDEI